MEEGNHMTISLDRRSFFKLSGVTAASLLVAGSATAIEPTEAFAASKTYGTNYSSTFRSKVLLDACNRAATKNMKAFKYKGKTYNCRDIQAMAVDEVNKRYYITRTISGGGAFVLSCPMSATNGNSWTVVGKYSKSWLKHANSMTCIPTGKGTRLLIATDSKKIRVIYIPDASKPSTGVKKSTWVCDSFDKFACIPRGLSYDRKSKCIVSRNGISKKNGNHFMKCFTFKIPTSKTTGTTHVKQAHYVARWEIEVPKYVTAPAGILKKKAYKCNTTWWSRQDMCYDGENLYVAYSNTKNGKYDGSVQKNVLVRWKVGSVASQISKYKAQMAKKKKSNRVAYRYPFNRALFDRSVKYNTQGFEFEGFDCIGNTVFMATNEGKNGIADRIRSFTI